ncbi:MAG: Gfo/Idh/MocA family oxidoreductase [Nitrospinae bacterium]|nr:Gfo/Idh/MocA family oxidoreductase [Nitrospinota bacterium]
MTTQEITIGIIGAGGIVRQRHMPGLQKIQGVRVLAVSNRTRESGERFAREYNVPHIFDDWRRLVAMKEIDAVWIGTWPYMHHPMTIAALDAGKHVFCQARMAMNVHEAREMLRKAQEKPRLVTMLCPPPFGMKGDPLMRKLIGEGYLGKHHNLVVRDMGIAYIDPNAPLQWRQIWALSGYNTLTVGMYAERLHRWFGMARKVVALDRTFTPERKTSEGKIGKAERPESVAICAELENGALAHYFFSGVARHAGHSMVEAYGSEGTLIYNMTTNEIKGARAGEKELQPIPIPAELTMDWTVEADFIAGLREGKKPSPSFEDGVKYMEFTEAVFRSTQRGSVVTLPLED